MKVKFFSRHVPTSAQLEWAESQGVTFEMDNHDFDRGLPGLHPGEIIAGVFPLDVLKQLQEQGHPVVTFVTTVRGLRIDQASPEQIKAVIFDGLTPTGRVKFEGGQ